MKTKKSFISALMVASFLALPAFAKTEGSYAGINLLRNKITFQEDAKLDSTKAQGVDGIVAYNTTPKSSNNKYGLGLSYKYAFNYNGFFVAPGATYDYYNNHARYDSPENWNFSKVQVKNRYAIKSDFGYDVTNKIAPYFTVGYSLLSASGQSNRGFKTKNKSSFVDDWFYGAGLKFDVTDQIALNLEYNTQKFRVKAGVPSSDLSELTANHRTKLETIKAGISYKF